MSRISALGLACLLTLCGCSTTSSEKPTWVTADCPPPQVIVDRAFKTEPPACLDTLATPKIAADATWGGIAIDATKAIKDRNDCLAYVAAWIASERLADKGAN